MHSLENKRKGRQLGSMDPQTLSRRVSLMGQRDLGGREGQKCVEGSKESPGVIEDCSVLTVRFLVTSAGDLKRKTKSQLA